MELITFDFIPKTISSELIAVKPMTAPLSSMWVITPSYESYKIQKFKDFYDKKYKDLEKKVF